MNTMNQLVDDRDKRYKTLSKTMNFQRDDLNKNISHYKQDLGDRLAKLELTNAEVKAESHRNRELFDNLNSSIRTEVAEAI